MILHLEGPVPFTLCSAGRLPRFLFVDTSASWSTGSNVVDSKGPDVAGYCVLNSSAISVLLLWRNTEVCRRLKRTEDLKGSSGAGGSQWKTVIGIFCLPCERAGRRLLKLEESRPRNEASIAIRRTMTRLLLRAEVLFCLRLGSSGDFQEFARKFRRSRSRDRAKRPACFRKLHGSYPCGASFDDTKMSSFFMLRNI